jgi:hypothetical protein
MEHDLSDQRPAEKLVPSNGKIYGGTGKEGYRDFARRPLKGYSLELVSAAPKVYVDICDMPLVIVHVFEVVIYVIQQEMRQRYTDGDKD